VPHVPMRRLERGIPDSFPWQLRRLAKRTRSENKRLASKSLSSLGELVSKSTTAGPQCRASGVLSGLTLCDPLQ